MSLLSSTYRGVNIAPSKSNESLRHSASTNKPHSLHVQMNELGSKYEKLGFSDKVALASINVDANDVPIEIDSYPSVRLYRAGSNEIVSFHGNFTQMLTLEQLDTFASQSGSHGVSVFNENKAHEEL